MLRLVLLLCLGTVVIQASNPDLTFLRPRTTGQCSCDDLKKRIDDIQASINQWHCPRGWQDFRGSCYMVSGTVTSWATARADCVGQQADLVTISSAEENAFVWNLVLEKSPSTKQAWIGFYRPKASASFVWVDSSTSTYTNWAPGEPNGPTTELCAHIYTDPSRPSSGIRQAGTWNDARCGGVKNWPFGHVCELRHTHD